jgi:protein-S-isoprenylcysteine O-methyltransferase Ste14
VRAWWSPPLGLPGWCSRVGLDNFGPSCCQACISICCDHIRVEEEDVLEENLGDEYREFERTRKRLIPGIW